MPLSTATPERLPDIETLRRLTKSIAMLEAIICPEWEYRYVFGAAAPIRLGASSRLPEDVHLPKRTVRPSCLAFWTAIRKLTEFGPWTIMGASFHQQPSMRSTNTSHSVTV